MKITKCLNNLNFALSPCSYSEGKAEIRKMIYVCAMGQNSNAVGLANNQIRGKLRVYVAKVNNRFRGFINPEIVSHSDKTHLATESCMSFPNKSSEIIRYDMVAIRHQVGEDKWIVEEFDETKCAVHQHEIDHLNGLNCHKIKEN